MHENQKAYRFKFSVLFATIPWTIIVGSHDRITGPAAKARADVAPIRRPTVGGISVQNAAVETLNTLWTRRNG